MGTDDRRRNLSRRTAITGGAALLMPTCGAFAQQKSLPVIGYLEPISARSPTNEINLAAFRKGLGEQGFAEGRNVAIEFRYADGQIDRMPALAAELVQRGVTVIMASTPNAARPAKALTQTIPIVFAQAADAVENGEVANLQHPEANLTGVANFNELGPKRFQLLSEMIPAAATTAYLTDPSLGSFERNLREVQDEAEKLKRRLQVFKASTDAELEDAFRMIAEQRLAGLFVGPVKGAYSRPGQIVAMAARHPIPAMYYDRAFVDAGGLMSYGAAFKEIFRFAGSYVGRILKGAKPSDLPVLRTNTFELVLNMKTARALGLTVPRTIIAAASEVIE